MKSGFYKKGKLPTVTQKDTLMFARETIEEIAETSKNHFVEGFRKGGYQTDESRTGWKPRKSADTGRAILVKTGALRRDLDVLSISKDTVVIGTKRIPYAGVHNEGGRVSERRPVRRKALKMNIGGKIIFRKSAAAFDMPKREFLGHSSDLNAKNIVIIKKFMKRVLKKGK